MSLSAEILVNLVAIETDTADIAKNTRVTRADYFVSLTEGTAANQAQIVWSDSRVSGGTDTLQLSALSDTRDGAAVTVNLTALKAIYLKNTGDTHTLTVTGAYTGSVAPGGVLVNVNPTATGTASATLYVTSTVGATYDIVIVGEGTAI
jgi:hypothetical protein